MMRYQTLRYETSGPIARVTLCRPEVSNAFNAMLIAELTAVFILIAAREDVRAVVFTGEGRSFCAGAEIEWMRGLGQADHEANVRSAKEMYAMFRAVATCPKPVVAGSTARPSAGESAWLRPAISSWPSPRRSSPSPRFGWGSSRR